jgi:tripartite-type tricarboxylate transporter receptor subunit TctC
MVASVKLVHVPYRSEAPALTDLLGGQVQAMFDNMSTSSEYIRAGKLRPLGVTTLARSRALPEVPTVADFLPDYEASAWFGVGMPKYAPTEIVYRLNTEINGALSDANIKAWLVEMDATALVGSPADFGKLIVDETGKWAKVVKAANIKA